MNCTLLTNDLLLAPNSDAQEHLSACAACRDRQQAVQLAVRALRALADEDAPVPPLNAAAIRAAIPSLAAAAGQRRPSGWWSVAAAAALLAAALFVGLRGGEQPPVRPVDRALESAKGTPETAPLPGHGAPDGAGTPPEVAGHTRPPDPVVTPPVDPPEPGGGTPLAHHGPLPPDPVDQVPDTTHSPDRPPFTPNPPPPPDPAPPALATIHDAAVIMRAVVDGGSAEGRDLNHDGRCDVADAMLAARSVAEGRLR